MFATKEHILYYESVKLHWKINEKPRLKVKMVWEKNDRPRQSWTCWQLPVLLWAMTKRSAVSTLSIRYERSPTIIREKTVEEWQNLWVHMQPYSRWSHRETEGKGAIRFTRRLVMGSVWNISWCSPGMYEIWCVYRTCMAGFETENNKESNQNMICSCPCVCSLHYATPASS
jgi:hypothetical protein